MRNRSSDTLDPFIHTVSALLRRQEFGADTDELVEGLSREDRHLVSKGAEVLAHFGTSVPEYSPPAPVSGEIDV